MIRKFIFIITLLFSLSARGQKLKLSFFSYNDKDFSSLIINRKPDYGFTGKDGCVVECQLSLNLHLLQDSIISGKVIDSENGEPTIGANIQVWFDNQKESQNVNADAKGNFQFVRQGNVIRMEVKSIGCRNLQIDLSKKQIIG